MRNIKKRIIILLGSFLLIVLLMIVLISRNNKTEYYCVKPVTVKKGNITHQITDAYIVGKYLYIDTLNYTSDVGYHNVTLVSSIVHNKSVYYNGKLCTLTQEAKGSAYLHC